MDKCQMPEGLTVRPDGVNELDPCLYEEIETIHNCTVHVLKRKRCGHIEIECERGEDDVS
ncbi:MAG: hypothetical protein IKO68_08335 [Oscillospiraceae bacterium]|nr:hypothetical protein [Oscillospiraceae bacterium]